MAVYPRVAKGIFASTPDEPNGTHRRFGPARSDADVTVLDMPVLASLLFQNTPTGRVVEPDLKSFEVYEDLPPDLSASPNCGANAYQDAFGDDLRSTATARERCQSSPTAQRTFAIPGGMPIVLHLGADTESSRLQLPRWQREEMTFLPGEYTHQSFPGAFFNNICGGCHGSISGRPIDAALRPDFLTQASQVIAIDQIATDLTGPPSSRGAIIGPPSTP